MYSLQKYCYWLNSSKKINNKIVIHDYYVNDEIEVGPRYTYMQILRKSTFITMHLRIYEILSLLVKCGKGTKQIDCWLEDWRNFLSPFTTVYCGKDSKMMPKLIGESA